MMFSDIHRAISISIGVAFLLFAAWAMRVNDLRARWHHQYEAEHSGRLADHAAYTAAQTQAATQNKLQIAKVEQQQQRITSDVEAQYRADLARLERLRPSNATPSSPPYNPGSPAPSPAACGPGGQAVPLPSDEILRAQETELQLNALIDWVLDQSKVDPNAH